MTQTDTTVTTATTSASTEVETTPSPLVTEHGRTVIADTVVAKIAGLATREVDGVADLGKGAARAVGAIRERIAAVGVDVAQGVSVEVGERQAAVDVDLVAEYGVSIVDLAGAVRSNVIDAIERMTGLEVTEVNITVHDVAVEGEEEDKAERVQ